MALVLYWNRYMSPIGYTVGCSSSHSIAEDLLVTGCYHILRQFCNGAVSQYQLIGRCVRNWCRVVMRPLLQLQELKRQRLINHLWTNAMMPAWHQQLLEAATSQGFVERETEEFWEVSIYEPAKLHDHRLLLVKCEYTAHML